MKKHSCKLVGTLLAILCGSSIFAGCETAGSVTIETVPGGVEVIETECTEKSAACQSAKKCMQSGALKTTVAKLNKKPKTPADKAACDKFAAEASQLAAVLAHAFQKGDAKTFVKALPEKMRNAFDEKKFKAAYEQLHKAMGEAISTEFVTSLAHPLLHIHVWKIGFKKKGTDGGEFTQETLFQVSIGKVDGHAQVISFGFL